MLLPTSTVAISFEGFRVIFVKILAIKPPCFFWISMCTLLEDTYAISNPEKKADRTNVVIMMMIDVVSIVSLTDWLVCKWLASSEKNSLFANQSNYRFFG